MRYFDPFKVLFAEVAPDSSMRKFPVAVCGLQHLLPSQELLFAAFRAVGLARSLPVIIGKLYSTVQSALPTEHYLAHEPLDITYRRGEFERAFKNALRLVCERQRITVGALSEESVVVLDDGGFVAGLLVPYFLAQDRRVVVVEQTTSGLRHAAKYNCPVVCVASSIIKREIESVLIAESVLRAMSTYADVYRGRKRIIGVAGFGAVGSALCRLIRETERHSLLVFDRDVTRCEAASFEGFKTTEDAKGLVEEADVLFGCTGEDFARSVDRAAIRRRSGCELLCASCGSSDFEFRSWITQSAKARLHKRQGRLGGNAFADIPGRFGIGGFRVLAGGFPINLDRTPTSDPEEDFILTRMLVFLGGLQAWELTSYGWSNGNALLRISPERERAAKAIWLECFPERLPLAAMRRADQMLSAPTSTDDQSPAS